jgi:hypothetical protein
MVCPASTLYPSLEHSRAIRSVLVESACLRYEESWLWRLWRCHSRCLEVPVERMQSVQCRYDMICISNFCRRDSSVVKLERLVLILCEMIESGRRCFARQGCGLIVDSKQQACRRSDRIQHLDRTHCLSAEVDRFSDWCKRTHCSGLQITLQASVLARSIQRDERLGVSGRTRLQCIEKG